MMNAQEIEKALSYHLKKQLPEHKASEVYFYACLPGGKFFRPSLVWSICKDLNPELFLSSSQNLNAGHQLLSSAVEIHHTYTLVHDDLPSMDNDTIRRGKPCTHIQYGEWQALLTGDGLLNISYALLAKIKHPRLSEALSFFSWCCGPKGLIHGQVLDLAQEMTISFNNTLRTHELKTARLIQASVVCSALIAAPTMNYKLEKKLWKFSQLLGINFQLIDDLSELAEETLSVHELDVNPWLKFPKESLLETHKRLIKFEALANDLGLNNTNVIIKEYYKKMLSIIEPNLKTINVHLNHELDLAPMLLVLNRFNS